MFDRLATNELRSSNSQQLIIIVNKESVKNHREHNDVIVDCVHNMIPAINNGSSLDEERVTLYFVCYISETFLLLNADETHAV